MNEQVNGQLKPPAQSQSNAGTDRAAGFGDAPRFTVDKASKAPGKKNEAVLGPFTIRDLTVFGSTLILFVASLIPMFAVRYNLWNLGSLFFLGLGIILPVIVAALFVARRVSPGTKIRIGSLSVDQFGSVVASFAVAFFFLSVAGAYVPSMLLALVGALGLLAATVLGRLIPVFAGDFLDRAEVPAHVVARESAVPVRKPRAPKAPKAATDQNAPKAAGTSTVAGWAKRITPGGQSGAGAAAAAGAAGAAAAAGSPAASGSATATPAASPETQVSGVVPAASAQAAPAAAEQTPAAEQTQAADVVPAAAGSATRQEPAAAAEDTRAAEAPAAAHHSAPTTVNPQVREQAPIGATVDPASRPAEDDVQPVYEAFWFAVAQSRVAIDEHSGATAFVIEPGGWVLALEDRGHEFLVQHTDGRVGVLRDLSNIERG
ncbi:hypothetical protein [Arthrobacter sp. EPSL27]|uniref:hypothetical protein n=1 Tax=Arthrobacter sp. EPSL27 TaxID=1745378 RepID=UPI0007465630|nr:hypothetical protein [Arthrobacter sp. EPSL27]KUM33455.1 hypothetical protein AR539_16115 [Arthrobacter sp. EPSL27]